MKRHFSIAIIIIVFGSYACQQDVLTETGSSSSDDLFTATENTRAYNQRTFSKKVGQPISHETGEHWIDNFKKEAKRNSASYVLHTKTISNLLQHSACIGISFHFAQDNTGKPLILPIGVDEHGKLMVTDTVATQTGPVNWHTAQQWIGNYKGAITSHFFGADTFSRLLTEDAPVIHLTEALDDRNNPQLLLSKGKAKAKGNPKNDDYEDGSWPCPPVCP